MEEVTLMEVVEVMAVIEVVTRTMKVLTVIDVVEVVVVRSCAPPLPVFVGEVHAQQDVLLRVLAPVCVHHHHVAHALRPATLQTHRLERNQSQASSVKWSSQNPMTDRPIGRGLLLFIITHQWSLFVCLFTASSWHT